ncbi:glycosyltransferase family 2 protein [Archangium violaceum]|nr:glycosyltransferase family 2 protein [Archangium violaceum]
MDSHHGAVTLQINLAPTDLPHARHILPHQLRQLAASVDEVLLVLDLHRSKGHRFAAAWEERRPGMEALLAELCARYPRAKVREVDYSPTTASAMAERFFGGKPVPLKDSRGGPYYSYVYGLHAATHDLVFHLDADILLGGGSPTWVSEAVRLLDSRPELLYCAPHPGPPAADGRLRIHLRGGIEPDSSVPSGFLMRRFSTRVFLMDRRRLLERLVPLKRKLAPPIHLLRALRAGNPPYREPENILTRAMEREGLRRLDFLGQSPGLWSLHPKWRSKEFYDALPEVIRRVEAGDMPEAQRGDDDLNDSLVDWTSARAALRQRKS